jgi:hypothetical protein
MAYTIWGKLIRALWRFLLAADSSISSTLSNTLNLLEQVQGVWRTKRDHIIDLCKKVNQLKGRFLRFEITHVLRVGIASFRWSCSNLRCISQLYVLLYECLAPHYTILLLVEKPIVLRNNYCVQLHEKQQQNEHCLGDSPVIFVLSQVDVNCYFHIFIPFI